MLPTNLLGDAAAAEELVKQATRTERPDQRAQNENFDRILRLAREENRLASVHPIPAIEESRPPLMALNRKLKRKRNRRFEFESPSLFHDQPPEIHEDMQPLLFNTSVDPVGEIYHHTDTIPDRGHIVDRKV